MSLDMKSPLSRKTDLNEASSVYYCALGRWSMGCPNLIHESLVSLFWTYGRELTVILTGDIWKIAEIKALPELKNTRVAMNCHDHHVHHGHGHYRHHDLHQAIFPGDQKENEKKKQKPEKINKYCTLNITVIMTYNNNLYIVIKQSHNNSKSSNNKNKIEW